METPSLRLRTQKLEESTGERGFNAALLANAAFVLNQDHCLGSIEVGKHADFVILDDDPYEVDPIKIKDINIRGTILAGEFYAAKT